MFLGKRKTKIKNDARAKKYLNSLPKMYLIGCWASYGIRSFAFSRQFDKDGIPLVWDYEDCNGTCDEWRLRPITSTTSGQIFCWTTNATAATQVVTALDKANYLRKVD